MLGNVKGRKFDDKEFVRRKKGERRQETFPGRKRGRPRKNDDAKDHSPPLTKAKSKAASNKNSLEEIPERPKRRRGKARKNRDTLALENSSIDEEASASPRSEEYFPKSSKKRGRPKVLGESPRKEKWRETDFEMEEIPPGKEKRREADFEMEEFKSKKRKRNDRSPIDFMRGFSGARSERRESQVLTTKQTNHDRHFHQTVRRSSTIIGLDSCWESAVTKRTSVTMEFRPRQEAEVSERSRITAMFAELRRRTTMKSCKTDDNRVKEDIGRTPDNSNIDTSSKTDSSRSVLNSVTQLSCKRQKSESSDRRSFVSSSSIRVLSWWPEDVKKEILQMLSDQASETGDYSGAETSSNAPESVLSLKTEHRRKSQKSEKSESGTSFVSSKSSRLSENMEQETPEKAKEEEISSDILHLSVDSPRSSSKSPGSVLSSKVETSKRQKSEILSGLSTGSTRKRFRNNLERVPENMEESQEILSETPYEKAIETENDNIVHVSVKNVGPKISLKSSKFSSKKELSRQGKKLVKTQRLSFASSTSSRKRSRKTSEWSPGSSDREVVCRPSEKSIETGGDNMIEVSSPKTSKSSSKKELCRQGKKSLKTQRLSFASSTSSRKRSRKTSEWSPGSSDREVVCTLSEKSIETGDDNMNEFFSPKTSKSSSKKELSRQGKKSLKTQRLSFASSTSSRKRSRKTSQWSPGSSDKEERKLVFTTSEKSIETGDDNMIEVFSPKTSKTSSKTNLSCRRQKSEKSADGLSNMSSGRKRRSRKTLKWPPENLDQEEREIDCEETRSENGVRSGGSLTPLKPRLTFSKLSRERQKSEKLSIVPTGRTRKQSKKTLEQSPETGMEERISQELFCHTQEGKDVEMEGSVDDVVPRTSLNSYKSIKCSTKQSKKTLERSPEQEQISQELFCHTLREKDVEMEGSVDDSAPRTSLNSPKSISTSKTNVSRKRPKPENSKKLSLISIRNSIKQSKKSILTTESSLEPDGLCSDKLTGCNSDIASLASVQPISDDHTANVGDDIAVASPEFLVKTDPKQGETSKMLFELDFSRCLSSRLTLPMDEKTDSDEDACLLNMKPRVLFPEEVDTKMQIVANPDESCEAVTKQSLERSPENGIQEQISQELFCHTPGEKNVEMDDIVQITSLTPLKFRLASKTKLARKRESIKSSTKQSRKTLERLPENGIQEQVSQELLCHTPQEKDVEMEGSVDDIAPRTSLNSSKSISTSKTKLNRTRESIKCSKKTLERLPENGIQEQVSQELLCPTPQEKDVEMEGSVDDVVQITSPKFISTSKTNLSSKRPKPDNSKKLSLISMRNSIKQSKKSTVRTESILEPDGLCSDEITGRNTDIASLASVQPISHDHTGGVGDDLAFAPPSPSGDDLAVASPELLVKTDPKQGETSKMLFELDFSRCLSSKLTFPMDEKSDSDEDACLLNMKPRVLFPEEVDTEMQMVANPDESCEVVDALDACQSIGQSVGSTHFNEVGTITMADCYELELGYGLAGRKRRAPRCVDVYAPRNPTTPSRKRCRKRGLKGASDGNKIRKATKWIDALEKRWKKRKENTDNELLILRSPELSSQVITYGRRN